MSKKISSRRKAVSLVIFVIGLLLFLSIFVSAALTINSGTVDGLEAKVETWKYRGIGGMVLIAIAQLMRGVMPSG